MPFSPTYFFQPSVNPASIEILYFVSFNISLLYLSGCALDNSNEVSSKSFVISSEESLVNEIEDFLYSIRYNKQPVVSGLEGLKVIEVAEAASKSLKSGNIINL